MSQKTLKIIALSLILITIVMGAVLAVLYNNVYKKEGASVVEMASPSPQDFVPEKTELIIDKKHNEMYTYDDMEADLNSLAKRYKNTMLLTSLAETEDGRTVYEAAAGKQGSENQYIVTASIHAREYITTKLVMLQLIDFLAEYAGEDVLFRVIPMVNPDGVAISQFGREGIKNEKLAGKLEEIAISDGEDFNNPYYFRQWKANANGVDLNRNFDAMWNEYKGTGHPSSDRYKGEYPGCEKESAALIRLTMENPIKKTVSYHTMGEVIYWYFAQTGELLEQTEALAKKLGNASGYRLDSDFESLDPAGYKDWALSALKIPGVTIEVGRGENPVDESQTDEIYNRNREVFRIISGY